jgi:endo-1,4-beta-xylanase
VPLAEPHVGQAVHALLKEHFDLVTAENECKFEATEAQQGKFTYGQCDQIMKQVQANNQSFRGHCTVWGAATPGWVNSLSKSAKRAALINHVKNVVTYYKGKGLVAWDIVNEAVNDGQASLKHNAWYPDVEDYIDVAFQTAHAADPDIKLFYNDYNADGVNQKSTFIYDMVKSMIQRGIPIHGVGLQMHLDTNSYPKEDDLRANIKRFGDLGLDVHITEMDIRYNGNYQKQAEIYHSVLKVCLEEPACKNFQVWGVIDRYSWRASDNPLLFDNSYKPKDAACSVLKAFQGQ